MYFFIGIFKLDSQILTIFGEKLPSANEFSRKGTILFLRKFITLKFVSLESSSKNVQSRIKQFNLIKFSIFIYIRWNYVFNLSKKFFKPVSLST